MDAEPLVHHAQAVPHRPVAQEHRFGDFGARFALDQKAYDFPLLSGEVADIDSAAPRHRAQRPAEVATATEVRARGLAIDGPTRWSWLSRHLRRA